MSARSVDTSTREASKMNRTTMSVPSAVSPKANSDRSKPVLPGKYSRQRELVYRAVMESSEHPTAEAVYQKVRCDCPDISLGTVYRNLGRLAECGAIRRIGVPEGSDHFDGTLREHYHLFCTSCGCVCDVDLPELEGLQQVVEQRTGFAVTGHDLILRGLCEDCRKKSEKENAQ